MAEDDIGVSLLLLGVDIEGRETSIPTTPQGPYIIKSHCLILKLVQH